MPSEPHVLWTGCLYFRIIVLRCSPNVDRIGSAYQRVAPLPWIEGLLRNDAATVRQLYQRHFPAVRSFVLQNQGGAEDAQDMFQEAMTVLWLKVKEGTLLHGTEPGAFLYSVARNKWLDHLRSAAFQRMKVVHDQRLSETFEVVDAGAEQRILRLRAIYGKLDDKCRTVLDRYYFERKDLATIAAELKVEVESIRTIKYRCMMKLRAFRRSIAGGDDLNE